MGAGMLYQLIRRALPHSPSSGGEGDHVKVARDIDMVGEGQHPHHPRQRGGQIRVCAVAVAASMEKVAAPHPPKQRLLRRCFGPPLPLKRVRGEGRRVLFVSVLATLALFIPAQADDISAMLKRGEFEPLAKTYFPGDAEPPAERRIFRLTRDQLDITVRALVPSSLGYPSVKTAIPRDPLQSNYEYAEMIGVNPSNMGALKGWIADIAARVRKQPTAVIDCKPAVPACLTEKSRAFVVKALRGDIDETWLAKFAKLYVDRVAATSFEQGTGDLVELVLNTPTFLFRGEYEINPKSRELTPAQLLQAVTYTLADAPPEALGLSSSKATEYLFEEGRAQETLRKVIASPQGREKLVRFFKAWLEVKEPGEFTISTEIFKEFTPQLAAAMVKETDQFLRAKLNVPAPKLRDITQATDGYISKALEKIYDTKSADDAGNKPVSLDTAKRLGIFSQAAVLASHSGPTDTRLIKRGAFWARKVLCREMDSAPPEQQGKVSEAEGVTEREKVHALTRGAACAGCHKIINPLGFFQESYDPLGRVRTTDNGAPVDPSTMINFLDEDPTKTRTSVDALKLLTNSAMFKQCFVRQAFRYYMGRNEEPADDPLLRRLVTDFAATDEQDISGVLFGLFTSDRAVLRK